jgi:hypothetical protein
MHSTKRKWDEVKKLLPPRGPAGSRNRQIRKALVACMEGERPASERIAQATAIVDRYRAQIPA